MKKSNYLIFIILICIVSAIAFFAGHEIGDSEVEDLAKELQIAKEKIPQQTAEIQKLQEAMKSINPEDSKDCRPPINSKKKNYVIGYGSLMNKQSRMITVPKAEYASPVLVSGFERIWASRGSSSHATYLLAVPNIGYAMNAIYYPATTEEISATDLREASYCRVKIPMADITPLGIKTLPKGDYWMYVKDFKDAEFPTKEFPILQTYADVFMSGCLQTQTDFNLTEFGKLCFSTTYNWDLANWFYDRPNPLYKRYSKEAQKYTPQIDNIISRINFKEDHL